MAGGGGKTVARSDRGGADGRSSAATTTRHRRPPRTSGPVVTDRDEPILQWVGRHGIVTRDQIARRFFGRADGVAVDGERFVPQRRRDERRYDGCIGVVGRLQGPEDVEQPEHQHPYPERVGVGQGVRLGGQLARLVGAEGPGHHVLPFG
jgi:hypothetical protein